jgi:hypothetical protein
MFFLSQEQLLHMHMHPQPHTEQTPLAFACSRSSGASQSMSHESCAKYPSLVLKGMLEDLDIHCEDECAMTSLPDLPNSIHPGFF